MIASNSALRIPHFLLVLIVPGNGAFRVGPLGRSLGGSALRKSFRRPFRKSAIGPIHYAFSEMRPHAGVRVAGLTGFEFGACPARV